MPPPSTAPRERSTASNDVSRPGALMMVMLTVAAPRSYRAGGNPRGRLRNDEARHAQPSGDGDVAGVHGALARARRAGREAVRGRLLRRAVSAGRR